MKLTEETDISIQIYSFLEVTAVCYDEKPNKDRQRCEFHDIKKEHNYVLDNSTEVTSQWHNGLHDISS